MVLDSVLEEQSYNKDNMIDMFIEGYLAACEVIDNNIKFTNVEEMTEVLEEVALQSIEELSSETVNNAIKKADENRKNGLKGVYGTHNSNKPSEILTNKYANNRNAAIDRYGKGKIDDAKDYASIANKHRNQLNRVSSGIKYDQSRRLKELAAKRNERISKKLNIKDLD